MGKNKTVLSVRDFAILYNVIQSQIHTLESPAIFFLDNEKRNKEEERLKKRLAKDTFYQDLLRIRDKLDNLTIEIKTPSVEVQNG